MRAVPALPRRGAGGSILRSTVAPPRPLPKSAIPTFATPPPPGYQTKDERIGIAGVEDLVIRSLLDRQQFDDPAGEAQRLGISSASWPLFGLLWPSGSRLAARLASRPVRAGERILEVGCGLALASLVGHRRGADVTASDRHPLAEHFLRENLRLNALGPMKYRHGDWNAPPAMALREAVAPPRIVCGRFDLIIGGDLLYEPGSTLPLAGFIERHCAPCGEVWIVDPDRGNRAAFSREMLKRGFGVEEERLVAPACRALSAFRGRMLTYRRIGAHPT